jgi:hypothetical protein
LFVILAVVLAFVGGVLLGIGLKEAEMKRNGVFVLKAPDPTKSGEQSLGKFTLTIRSKEGK